MRFAILLPVSILWIAGITACDSLPFLRSSTPAPTAAIAATTQTPAPQPTVATASSPASVVTATTVPPTSFAPTLLATSAPTASAATPTVAPTATALPTETSVPPTRPAVFFTATPRATATSPAPAFRYSAPELVEPGPKATVLIGKGAMILKWRPVGALQGGECYQVNVTVINPVDNRIASQSYVTNCADNGTTGTVNFTIRERSPAPDYIGLVADATSQTAANRFTVRWTVAVVQDLGGGKVAQLGPVSAPLEFALQEP